MNNFIKDYSINWTLDDVPLYVICEEEVPSSPVVTFIPAYSLSLSTNSTLNVDNHQDYVFIRVNKSNGFITYKRFLATEIDSNLYINLEPINYINLPNSNLIFNNFRCNFKDQENSNSSSSDLNLPSPLSTEIDLDPLFSSSFYNFMDTQISSNSSSEEISSSHYLNENTLNIQQNCQLLDGDIIEIIDDDNSNVDVVEIDIDDNNNMNIDDDINIEDWRNFSPADFEKYCHILFQQVDELVIDNPISYKRCINSYDFCWPGDE